MAEPEFRVQATRGVIWNYLYKFAEFGLISIYSVVVVRHFGPSVSAPYAIFLSVASILTMFGAFAVDGVLLRFIQRVKDNPVGAQERFDSVESLSLPHFLTTLLSFRMLTVALVSICVVVVLIGIPAAFPSASTVFGSLPSESWLLVAFLFAQAVVAFSTFALTGLLETKLVFFASLIARIALLGAGVLLLQGDTFSTDRAIMIYVGSSALSALLLFASLRYVVRRRHRHDAAVRHLSLRIMASMVWSLVRWPKRISLLLATPLMIYGITTWGNDILSTILGKQSDVMMMGFILGNHSAEIGYYQAASTILLITEYVFLFGFGGTLVSIFSKLVHDDESAAESGTRFPSLAKMRREIAGSQNVLLLPLSGFVLLFAESIVGALYGSDFRPAVGLLRVGLAALIASVGFFGGGMQVTTLVSIGKERVVFRNRLFWGCANMIGNVALIYYYGAMGALIGTQYANLGAVMTEWYLARRFVTNSTNIGATLRILLISLVSSAVSYWLVGFMSTGANPWQAIILGGVVNGLLVIGLYKVLRISEFATVLHRIGLRSA